MNDTRFTNTAYCEQFVDKAVPPAEMEFQDSLTRDQLLADLCIHATSTVCTTNALRRAEAALRADQADFCSAVEEYKLRRRQLADDEARLKKVVVDLQKKVTAAEAETQKVQAELSQRQKLWEEFSKRSNNEKVEARSQFQAAKQEIQCLNKGVYCLGLVWRKRR